MKTSQQETAPQKIEFTDFPAPGVELYLTDNVLLLPGEY